MLMVKLFKPTLHWKVQVWTLKTESTKICNQVSLEVAMLIKNQLNTIVKLLNQLMVQMLTGKLEIKSRTILKTSTLFKWAKINWHLNKYHFKWQSTNILYHIQSPRISRNKLQIFQLLKAVKLMITLNKANEFRNWLQINMMQNKELRQLCKAITNSLRTLCQINLLIKILK